MTDHERFIDECFAVCHNYVQTGQFAKVLEMLGVLRRAVPDHQLLNSFTSELVWHGEEPSLSFSVSEGSFFGKDWRGEDLSGKSIEVFVDQGVGDLIMLLRYLDQMKKRWDCRIVLNCYAHYSSVSLLLSEFQYECVKEHIVCDYQTNLCSIPALLNGLPEYYPTKFEDLLAIEIPEQPLFSYSGTLRGLSGIGIAWESNPHNKLCVKKSVPLDLFGSIKGDAKFVSLLPQRVESDVLDVQGGLGNFFDTFWMISSLDAVISVDTAVLHLAGTMRKPTFGLLAYDADRRWGDGDTTPWYPSVRLFRQSQEGSWKEPLIELAKVLKDL